MNTYLFIAVCVLSVLVVIIFTFVSAAIHKRELCRKSPYYFCDTDWLCCKNVKDSSGNPVLCDVVGVITAPGPSQNAYFLTDQLYGTNKGTNPSGQSIYSCAAGTSAGNDKTYYEACVEPVQVITKYYNNLNTSVSLDCLYTTSDACNPGLVELRGLFPTLDLKQGQCCYKRFDPTNENSEGIVPGAYYPSKDPGTGSVNQGSWNTASVFPNQYTDTGNYFYNPKQQDTTNNSCFNTLYGAPPAVSGAVRYLGCPGA